MSTAVTATWAQGLVARFRRIPRQTMVLVGVALAARLAYWLFATPEYIPMSDAAQYFDISNNVAEGNGVAMAFPWFQVHHTAFRPPVYPLVLGSGFWLFGATIVVGRVLSLITGLGVVVLSERVGRELGGPSTGLAAGLLVALYPQLIVNDVTLLTESLSLLVLLALLLALLRNRLAWAGLWCGLLVLTRPSAQGLVVVVGAWVLWRFGWRKALVTVGLAALVVAPWVIRNWARFGEPMLVSSNGFNAAAIYSPPARERKGFVDPTRDPYFNNVRLSQSDEALWQSELQAIAFDSIRDAPSQIPAVVERNLRSYFELNPSLNEIPERLDGRNMTVRQWSLPLFYVITALAVAGTVLFFHRRGVGLVAACGSYFALTSLVLVAPPRLRAPFDLACCLLAGLVLPALVDRVRRAQRQWVLGGAPLR